MGKWLQPSGQEEIAEQDENIDKFYIKITLRMSAYQTISLRE